MRRFASSKYSADNSTPINLRPVCWQASAVVPPPMNGSRTTPPSGVTWSRSITSGRGLPVKWTLSAATTWWLYTPGKHRRVYILAGALAAWTTNSASRLKLPSMGLALGLCQTTIPRHSQPAACIASVMTGSWRQSLNTRARAPGLATRQHSESHKVAHSAKLC